MQGAIADSFLSNDVRATQNPGSSVRLRRHRRELGEALRQPKTEFTRDSAILRFELTYEVTWKLLQALLREEGYEVNSPRQAFQRAFAIGWIGDEQIWDDIIRARNAAVHVYREADAERLFGELEQYQRAFDQLANSLSVA